MHRVIVMVLMLTCLGLAACSVAPVLPQNDGVGADAPGPPTIVVTERPRLVFAAAYSLYFAPDLEVDLYFDHGVWYYYYEALWYQSSHFRGPWNLVPVKDLPPGLKKVVPGHLRKVFREREAREKSKAEDPGLP